MRLHRSCALAVLLSGAAPVMAQAPPPAAPRASYDQVVAQLTSPDADARRDSLRALGATAYPAAIAQISQLLTDPVDDIQLETIYTLLSFYHVELPEVLDRRKGLKVRPTSRLTVPAQRIYDLGPFGLIPQPVPVELTNGLAQSMFDKNPRVRLESVYALGVMARPPLDGYAADALPRLLQDPVEEIRVAAARVIGGLRVTTGGDALVAALNDKSTPVATAAMRALGDIRAWQSLQALTDQFTHYNGKGPRAEAAFDALARIAHVSSQPLFTAQLTSSSPNLRRLAAEGLARSGNHEAAQQAGNALAKDKEIDVLLADVRSRMARIKNSAEAMMIFGVQRAVAETPQSISQNLTRFVANKSVGLLTNVPGPRAPIYLAGHKVAGILGWVPTSSDQSIGLCIFSYNGHVNIGIATDAGIIPDPDRLEDLIQEGFAGMVAGS